MRWARLRKTFVRGPLALVDAISIGLKASEIAMREATGVDTQSGGSGVVLVPVAVGVLGVFIALPGMLSAHWEGVAGDLGEAAMRLGVLLVYLVGIGRSAFARRLFAYHGAEHKTIAAYERHERMPTLDEARAESPIHIRCGTDFIAIFVFACGVTFAFVPREPIWLAGSVRVALVPLVAALAYEVMRAAARWEGTLVARGITLPGRALQRITTREPTDDLLEVASVALRSAIG